MVSYRFDVFLSLFCTGIDIMRKIGNHFYFDCIEGGVVNMNRKREIQYEADKCAGHHFARVTLDVGRRIEEEHTITYTEEYIVGEGFAKRSSKDRSDDYVGETLALARALEVLAYRVAKRACGKVKHNDDMKLQRAHKKEYADYLKQCFPTMTKEVKRYRPVESENISTVGQAIEKGLNSPVNRSDHGDSGMVVCDDLFKDTVERFEDTHFEDSEEERLIDEC